MSKVFQNYILPFILPVVLALLVAALLSGIGETFLGVFIPGDADRLDRPELWVGVGILTGVVALATFLYNRPAGSLGALDKDVAIGGRPLWADDLPPVNATMLRGEPGTIADVQPGYTLYAQSGALARVLGTLPGGNDYGKRFSGFFYAQGLGHAANELWIPFEAVTAVYPETRSAFLAIKGDETEAFGWTTPPENLTRGSSKHKPAADKIK
jgi:hypothetical protein